MTRPRRPTTLEFRPRVPRSSVCWGSTPCLPAKPPFQLPSLELDPHLSSAGHNYIGTEHILLGLLREGEGVASRVLETLGADPQKIRTQVRRQPANSVQPLTLVSLI